MLPIEELILHHSGSTATWLELERWWRQQNLRSYYHWLVGYVDGSPQIIKGLQDFKRGQHIKLMNTHRIGICVIGDYSDLNPDRALMKKLDVLVYFLVEEHEKINKISPHNKHYDTICPGPYLTQYAKEWNIFLKNVKRGR